MTAAQLHEQLYQSLREHPRSRQVAQLQSVNYAQIRPQLGSRIRELVCDRVMVPVFQSTKWPLVAGICERQP